MKKFFRILAGVLTPVCAAAMVAVVCLAGDLPMQFNVTEGGVGNPTSLSGMVQATPQRTLSGEEVPSAGLQSGDSYTVSLKLFGVIPVKEASVKVVDTQTVIPCGTPFGIKLFTDGVLIVGMSDVDISTGLYNPAQSAGLKLGDVIEAIEGQVVSTKEDVASAVERSGGKTLAFRIRRDNIVFDVRFTPVKSMAEGRYKAGLWVRDSSAGIGTMTFYLPGKGIYAGLGHPVCDVDTGEALPISDGEIVPAQIYDVTKGKSGQPGELRGGFEEGTLGGLTSNSETGVYGLLAGADKRAALPVTGAVPVAMKQQVRQGYAQVLCTVDGTEPQLYDIRIDQVRYKEATPTRGLVITITDPALIAKTGGIVQGMSGSPILQDGRLVGAVTHVFVGEPLKGHGIFAENMLKTAATVQSVGDGAA